MKVEVETPQGAIEKAAAAAAAAVAEVVPPGNNIGDTLIWDGNSWGPGEGLAEPVTFGEPVTFTEGFKFTEVVSFEEPLASSDSWFGSGVSVMYIPFTANETTNLQIIVPRMIGAEWEGDGVELYLFNGDDYPPPDGPQDVWSQDIWYADNYYNVEGEQDPFYNSPYAAVEAGEQYMIVLVNWSGILGAIDIGITKASMNGLASGLKKLDPTPLDQAGEGVVSAPLAHAEGQGLAQGIGSHAEGGTSIATGQASHAEGYATANASGSHAEGTSVAEGIMSHAEGDYAEAMYQASHAQGFGTFGDGIHGSVQYVRHGFHAYEYDGSGGFYQPFGNISMKPGTWRFQVDISAVNPAADEAAGWMLRGVVTRETALDAPRLVGAVTKEAWKDDNDWDAEVAAHEQGLQVAVNGTPVNTRWVAVFTFIELRRAAV